MRLLSWIRLRWSAHEWPLYVVTALVAGGLTVTALELWAARLTVPITYWGDALAVAAHFKTVLETGWYEYQPLLGAPFGQTYNDFPTADNLNFMAAWILGLFTDDFAVAMNLYFILGFPAAALTALWLFRKLGITKIVSLVMSVLFALAPYHFVRGQGHLWLASYYVVPLSLGLVLMVLRDEPLWKSALKGSPWYRHLTSRSAGTFLILLLSATAQSYYAIFFLILLAFAGVVRLIRTGNWSNFWGATAAGAITAVGMLLNMLPDMLYSLLNGQNPSGLQRGHADSEIYALKLSQLLLPWVGHRIDALRNLRLTYDSTYPLPSESPALGAIASIGLVALFLGAIYVATTRSRSSRRFPFLAERGLLLTQLASLLFVCFIFATVGGLSTFISFVTTSLRGWNRISIFMALICLAAVGVLLDLLIRWLREKTTIAGLKAFIAIGIASAFLIAGYIDQTPEQPSKDYPAVINAFGSDEAWFREIDSVMPAGAKVLQLPYQPFPESRSLTGVEGSSALIPYLHTSDIRWSAGGIKGRPRADWPRDIEKYAPADIVELAAAAGFAGIHIDRTAMQSDARAALEDGIDSALASKPLVSDNGRYAFYDIRSEAKVLKSTFTEAELRAVGRSVVNPLEIDLSPSFLPLADEGEETSLRSSDVSPTMTLLNATGKRATAFLSMNIRTDGGVNTRPLLLLTLPDGTRHSVTLNAGEGSIAVPVVVRPGSSEITLTVPGSTVEHPVAITVEKFMFYNEIIAPLLTD